MCTCRRELRKLKKILSKSRAWLCIENCKRKDPQCEICTMIFLINSSCAANKRADILTFRNSYLCEPFERVCKLYKNHQERVGWNSYTEEQKKDAITSYGNSCLCM